MGLIGIGAWLYFSESQSKPEAIEEKWEEASDSDSRLFRTYQHKSTDDTLMPVLINDSDSEQEDEETDKTVLPLVKSNDEEYNERAEGKSDELIKAADGVHYEATETSANAQVSLFPARRGSSEDEASVSSESRERDIIGSEVDEPVREGSVQLP